jgi:hypothetical protein
MKGWFAGCTSTVRVGVSGLLGGTSHSSSAVRWRAELLFSPVKDPCVTRWWLDQVGDLAHPPVQTCMGAVDLMPLHGIWRIRGAGWLTVSAPRTRELSCGSVEKPHKCRSTKGLMPRSLGAGPRAAVSAEQIGRRYGNKSYYNPNHSVAFHSRYGGLQSQFSRISELQPFEPRAVAVYPRSGSLFPERLLLESGPSSNGSWSRAADCGRCCGPLQVLTVVLVLAMCRALARSRSRRVAPGMGRVWGPSFFLARLGFPLWRRCRCALARAASPFHWRRFNVFRQPIVRSGRPLPNGRRTSLAGASESAGGGIEPSAGCRWAEGQRRSCGLVSHFLFGPWRYASRRPTAVGMCQKGWRPTAPCPIRHCRGQWGVCISIVLG